jgi:hypothetical protein
MQKGVNKRGAIELSIGTIVVVVLAMSMLILGLMLIKGIFSTSTTAVSQIDTQLKNQLSKLFGEDKKLVVYPDTRRVEVRQGKIEGFAVAIKNLQSGSTASGQFSYEVVVSDMQVREKCGVTDAEILDLITTGQSDANIPLASGEITEIPVFFETQVGDPQCTVRFRINVKVGGQNYASEIMDVTFKA